MLEVEPAGQRATAVAKTTTEPSPTPLQKHSLGVYTVNMLYRRTVEGGEHIVSPRDSLFNLKKKTIKQQHNKLS